MTGRWLKENIFFNGLLPICKGDFLINKERRVTMSPVIIPENLPASEQLQKENIFIMNAKRAIAQDIRPLKVVILNLMPTKIVTETQILRLLSNNLIQLELTFLHMATHESKNTPKSHLNSFYTTFDTIQNKRFDALIVTGAPIELLPFEDVDYWQELTSILDWADTHVHASLFICWGAQAALYHYYDVQKRKLEKKLSGIYEHKVLNKTAKLMRGFDDCFHMPHSRNTEITEETLEAIDDLEVIASSEIAGSSILASLDRKQIFVTGHPEYDEETLGNEYLRDQNKGLNIEIPENYCIYNNPDNGVIVNWRSHAHLLYANWINYYVYQETDYYLG